MIVNFEFLDRDPIENVITCMNKQIDGVVFFGYADVIDEMREKTVSFLKTYCGVVDVRFVEVEREDLSSVLVTMREVIEETGKENRIFFDVTGGESLLLVAFGILSVEYETPMHMYDVVENELIVLNGGSVKKSVADVPDRKTELNIDRYFRMIGGRVTEKRAVDGYFKYKYEGFEDDVAKICAVAVKYNEYWVEMHSFIRNRLAPAPGARNVSRDPKDVLAELEDRFGANARHRYGVLNMIVDDFLEAGLLTGAKHRDGKWFVEFRDENVISVLLENENTGGKILELFTYLNELKSGAKYCEIGVRIDWDGVIHGRSLDVENEIDVITVKGNVVTFISCKIGDFRGQNKSKALHPLYELETVARRLGGKYSKKVLMTSEGLTGVYSDRAKDLGIEVRCFEDEYRKFTGHVAG